tara:strand:+ start:8674 stop:8871 length:198 start_codon:yes stop_codon:yes gene_type:complete
MYAKKSGQMFCLMSHDSQAIFSLKNEMFSKNKQVMCTLGLGTASKKRVYNDFMTWEVILGHQLVI